MNKLSFTITLLLLSAAAMAQQSYDDLWDKLNSDFESKPYFFNSSINDERDSVMSAFIPKLFGEEYATNNAHPLTPTQLQRLPDGRFLEKTPFILAMKGRERLLAAGKIKNHPLLAVADFSQSSRNRRFYLMDIQKGEVLINTWTSHGITSDKDRDGYAETFSNISGSRMSSVGFMSSDITYNGSYGYSLRLKGHDPKLNSNVFSRAVVVHGFGGLGAQDASWGNVPTSEGCLMFSLNESGRFWGLGQDRPMYELIINTLKKGALIFTYTDIEDTDGTELIFKSSWIKKSDI